MEEKLTNELLNNLLSKNSIERFLDDEILSNESLDEYLNRLLVTKQLKKSEIIKKSALNATFTYQIFSGERHPSRNKILQLAFGMGLNLQEAQRLLKISGANELYCKNRRDAIIIHCLYNGLSLMDTEDYLFEFKESGIC
jgi:DNA-binding phage protein